jgi:hypothetical protein
MSLSAHCDTTRVSEGTVMAIPSPPFTKTWHPMSHGAIVRSLSRSIKLLGVGVRGREFSVNKSGSRMFGTFHLDEGSRNTGFSVGFRNSTDKSMVLGFCAGTTVFVCDNMCFSGTYQAYRMHTGTLTDETLDAFVNDAVQKVVGDGQKMIEWQEGLANVYVPKDDYKVLAYDMIEEGVFASGQLGNYKRCLEEEKELRRGHALDCTTSLYNVHGAATRLMKGWNMLRTAEATPKLAQVCDDYLVRRAA